MRHKTDYELKTILFSNDLDSKAFEKKTGLTAYNLSGTIRVPEWLSYDYVVCNKDEYELLGKTFGYR